MNERKNMVKCGHCSDFIPTANVEDCLRLGVCKKTNQFVWNSNYCTVISEFTLELFTKCFIGDN